MSGSVKPILAIIFMISLTVLSAITIYEYLKDMEMKERTATVDIEGFENNSVARFRVVLEDRDRAYGFSLAVYCNIIQSIKNLEGNYANFHFDIKHDYWGNVEYVKHAEIQFPTGELAEDFMGLLEAFLMADEIEYELEWR